MAVSKPRLNKQAKKVRPSVKKRLAESGSGLKFSRYFTDGVAHPFDQITWEKRNALILDEKGNVVFELKDAEVPSAFSQLATDIAVSKYFRKAGVPGTGHEVSFKQLVARVVKAIKTSGEEHGGYFATPEDAEIFADELAHLLVNQKVAFNSPVWFNCGLWHAYGIEGRGGSWFWNKETQQIEETVNAYEHPQCSACFIQSIDDDLMSIFDLAKNEAILFKYGSGTGTNFSKIRARGEKLGGGGSSSGLISFLEVLDRGAGSIKSGGTTRRAAKMVILDIDHPEIVDFIQWKVKEERKAKILIEHGGYPSDFNGEAYHTVAAQNSNNSVRVSDDFMHAYLEDAEWSTRSRMTGEVMATYKARDLMNKISESAWECADPGIQFDTTVNNWHTCSATDRIYGSNPCSEYMFLDNSACNLASFNLMKFVDDQGNFDTEAFERGVDILITAMDIIVGLASYPTKPIAQNSHDFRPLGLGYANIGTLLMNRGLPYDSKVGRDWAAAITAILHCRGYRQSALLAKSKGTFVGYPKNRQAMLGVIAKHRDAALRIDARSLPEDLVESVHRTSSEMLSFGHEFGYRNSQATNIAPTGTIGLLMDCDTTGIEPDFALVKFKKLAGGGFFRIVNQSVPRALSNLGYNPDQVNEIIAFIIGTASLSGDTPINEQSLRDKGLTDEDIAGVNKVLPTVFELEQAFNPRTITPATLLRLGVGDEQAQLLGFNLLHHLKFTNDEILKSNDEICGRMTIEGAPHIKDEHLAIFDCANRCGRTGKRFIAPMGHVKMMAAVQPFISGAISKTVNLPNESTAKEIEDIYVEAWKLGVKAIAMYRDGSKSSQPLSSKTKDSENAGEPRPLRRHLPDERQAITHKFSINGQKGFLTVGLFEDGTPGEIFIMMSKKGSVISGLLDGFAVSISFALQYGVPLRSLVNKFAHTRFEPAGFTGNKHIPIAKSIFDYIFRWMAFKFLPESDWQAIGIRPADGDVAPMASNIKSSVATSTAPKAEVKVDEVKVKEYDVTGDAPACDTCGGMMTRSGTCYKCMNCGSTSGCS